MKKKFLITLIAICTMLFALGMINVSAATSGTCGENLDWTLDDEGTLTISGEGDMSEWGSPFQNNLNIKKVIVNEGVTSLGWNAFSRCSNLKSVSLPASLETIKSYAFFFCTSLDELNIPKNVTNIGGGIVAGTHYLNIFVDVNNLNFCSVEGVLFNKNKTKIIAYAKDGLQPIYEIPSTVTTIGEKAFANCWYLTNVIIPETVSVIEREAFRNCHDLQNIEIPDKVTRLESQVFFNCAEFTNIKIHKNISYVGDGALTGCGRLMIEVEEGNPYYCAIDGVLFNKDATELVCYSRGLIDTSYTVPEGVIKLKSLSMQAAKYITEFILPSTLNTIESMAFQGCDRLKTIKIPSGITCLPNSSFASCQKLESVTLPSSITQIEYYAFSGCNSLNDIYYDGTEKQWLSILISNDGNENLFSANIHYNHTTNTKITSLSADNTGKISLTAINVPDDATVFVASYNGLGKLLEIHELTLDNGVGEEMFSTKDVYNYKAFVWDGNLMPFVKPSECYLK